MLREDLEYFSFFKDEDLTYAFDNLTGVLNREIITSYIEYLISENKQFSLCLCDLDNFKHVNDSYGHIMGDKVLQTFADVVCEKARGVGVVGRFGGDEFMIVLEGVTEYNEIWKLCHSINGALPLIKFDDAEDLSITTTMGISRFPIDGKSYTDILSTSDKALYRGKMKGRNCFIIYIESKHANILINRDAESVTGSTDRLAKAIEIISKDAELGKNITQLVKYFAQTYMYEYVAVEDSEEVLVSATNKLSKNKENFGFVPVDIYRNQMNSTGLVYINHRRTLTQIDAKDFYDELKKKKIFSTIAVSIDCNGVFYGLFKADTSNTSRIWQQSEMDLFTVAAKVIGYCLYSQKKTLKDIFGK